MAPRNSNALSATTAASEYIHSAVVSTYVIVCIPTEQTTTYLSNHQAPHRDRAAHYYCYCCRTGSASYTVKHSESSGGIRYVLHPSLRSTIYCG